jgi:hypothetical protein
MRFEVWFTEAPGRVIAVDTDLLVYAHREDVTWFQKASDSLCGPAEGSELWAILWPCLYES